MTSTDPQPGDWVLIRAKVLGRPIPEDVEIELFSRTDQFPVRVRVDLCEPTAKSIPDEPDEGSVALLDREAWQLVGDGRWYSAITTGDEVGRTWAELQALGDVEVIHHG